MARGDLDWLVDEVGIAVETALEVLVAADWAEMQRLIDIYGYPKDNVRTPSLASRLSDTRFADHVLVASEERDHSVRQACEKAITAAHDGLSGDD